jgi:hypothetical protein
MRTSTVRLLMMAAVALLTACDAGTVSPPAFERPSFSGIPASNGRVYTLVLGNIPTAKLSASAWIDKKGGYVTLDGPMVMGRRTLHTIYVSERAVLRPTLFTMEVEPGEGIAVKLTAKVQERNGTWTDVGAQGFREPVYLVLSYAMATNVVNPNSLTILYDPENGTPHQPVKSFVPTQDKFVVGELWHFSRYVVGMD